MRNGVSRISAGSKQRRCNRERRDDRSRQGVVAQEPESADEAERHEPRGVVRVDRRELDDEEEGERDSDEIVREASSVGAPELAKPLHATTVITPSGRVIVSEARIVLEDDARVRRCGRGRAAVARSDVADPGERSSPADATVARGLGGALRPALLRGDAAGADQPLTVVRAGEPDDLHAPPGLGRMHHSAPSEVEADVPEPRRRGDRRSASWRARHDDPHRRARTSCGAGRRRRRGRPSARGRSRSKPPVSDSPPQRPEFRAERDPRRARPSSASVNARPAAPAGRVPSPGRAPLSRPWDGRRSRRTQRLRRPRTRGERGQDLRRRGDHEQENCGPRAREAGATRPWLFVRRQIVLRAAGAVDPLTG